MKVVVVCEDGVVRHAEPFPSKAEAAKWAWWGHLCTATHTFTSQPDEPS